MDTQEKWGCEGRWVGEACLKGIDNTGERKGGVCICNEICPTGKRTKQGPNQFKGMKSIFQGYEP